MKRRLILDAAVQVFSEKGYHDARVVDIAKAAGIAKGSVYLYFKTKEALFSEMVKEGIRRYKALKMDVLERDLPLYEKLRTLLLEETEFLWENREIARILFTSERMSQDVIYDWLMDIRELFIQTLSQEFEVAMEAGVVSPGDSELYTRIFRGMEQQVIFYYILIDGEKPDPPVIDRALAALGYGIFD